jgi:protein-L-isoaspartate(D-aspartate) O-methyltransferase
MTEDDVAAARRWFAEELRHVARVRSHAVVRAFATVPREHFAGPGPWRLLSPDIYGTTGPRKTPIRATSTTTC